MALAPKTVLTYPLNGTNRDFTIPFEYLARKFVQVTLIGTDRKLLTLNIDYRFTLRTIITLTKNWGPADGYERIEIRRYTSATERLVDFSDGSILRAYDLNTSQVQSLHIAEEGRDVASDTIGVNNDGDLDARGRKIVNLADAIADGDAVNLRMQKTWAATALGYSKAAGISAGQAAQSAANASTSAGQSNGSAQASATSAGQSVAARDLALQYRDSASGFADQAGQAVTAAQVWANTPEDTVVSGGLYSSLHYSRKSAASAVTSGQSASAAAGSATTAGQQAGFATTEANRSKTEADRSAEFAAGLNLPSAAGNAGLQLSQNITETGLEYRGVPQANMLINSAMQVWQRAIAFTNYSGYTADRWRQQLVGAGTCYTVLQQIGSKYYHRISVATKGTLSRITLEQRIEDVEATAEGAWVTVSFKMVSTLASGRVQVALVQNFGSGGSAAVTTTAAVQNITSTALTRYEFRVQLPVTTGKTIGANSYLGVQIIIPTFGVQIFDITDVKAEEGFRATPYERPLYGDEFLRCARYFWRTSPIDWNWASHAAGAIASRYTNLPVIMRPGAVLTTNVNTPASSGGADLNRLSMALNGYRNEIRWICYSTFAADSIYIGFNGNNFIQVDAEL